MKQITSLFICAIMTYGLANAQEAAYRFEKGKEYKYLIEQTNMQLQELPGQSVTINSELTMSVVYTMLDLLDNGNLRMQATIESALMINESPNGTQTLGADMAGKSVIFELGGDGQLVEVDSSIRDIQSEGVVLLMGTTSVFPRLDASKISDGNSWSVTEADTTGEGEGKIIEETERDYKVKGRKTVSGLDCHEITLTSEAKRKGKMIRGDQEMQVSGTREGKATIMYGHGEGVLVSFEAEMNMDQTIFVVAQNMRVPITATQNVKIELINK
jgi:hypothetical protein